MHVVLQAVGTKGTAAAERGGAGGRQFRLLHQASWQAEPTQVGGRGRPPLSCDHGGGGEEARPPPARAAVALTLRPSLSPQIHSSSTGVEEEIICFARLVRAAMAPPGAGPLTLTAREAGAAAATDGSDPEWDAAAAGTPAEAAQAVAAEPAAPEVTEGSSKARLKDMPSEEDAWCIRCVGWLRAMHACMQSAAPQCRAAACRLPSDPALPSCAVQLRGGRPGPCSRGGAARVGGQRRPEGGGGAVLSFERARRWSTCTACKDTPSKWRACSKWRSCILPCRQRRCCRLALVSNIGDCIAQLPRVALPYRLCPMSLSSRGVF